jgi:hypothetical protein
MIATGAGCSVLSDQLARFLEFKRAAGYRYREEARVLHELDRFLAVQLSPNDPSSDPWSVSLAEGESRPASTSPHLIRRCALSPPGAAANGCAGVALSQIHNPCLYRAFVEARAAVCRSCSILAPVHVPRSGGSFSTALKFFPGRIAGRRIAKANPRRCRPVSGSPTSARHQVQEVSFRPWREPRVPLRI